MDLDHEQIEALLGAYALDAVDPDERAALSEHLTGCPRCRAEVDGHRQTAAALGNVVEEAPPDLWDRISGEVAAGPRPHRAPDAPAPRLGTGGVVPVASPFPPTPDPSSGAGRGTAPGVVTPVTPRSRAGRAGRAGRSPRSLTWIGVALAAAAVVAIGILAVNLGRVSNQVNRLQQHSAVSAPLSGTPVALHGAGGITLARFTVAPDGRGVLTGSAFRPLGADQVYQLWAVRGSTAISLGVMGRRPRPGRVTFTWATGGAVRLAVTVEPAGGTAQPTTQPVAASALVRA
jgi:anti-sigma-K factor RskA